MTYGRVGGEELVHKALVPGVHAVLENLGDGVQETVFAATLLGKSHLEVLDEFGGVLVVDKHIVRLAGRGAVGLASVLLGSRIVSRLDEGDNELANSAEKLERGQ